MKNKLLLFSYLVIATLPFVSSAQSLADNNPDGGAIGDFLENVLTFIDSYVIPFILGIGFLVFVWGMFQYFIRGGADPEAQKSGKSLILYAIGGFVIILAFWGIVNIITDGIGLGGEVVTAPGANLIDN